uniref:Uncharacterized protein n=1 Tax=Arundo donax TaxID=35708 RepID=A0A0A9B602_ARUDO
MPSRYYCLILIEVITPFPKCGTHNFA